MPCHASKKSVTPSVHAGHTAELQTRNRVDFKIYRFDPERDSAPRLESFTLELGEQRGMMLLVALHQLKEQDPSLTFRHSCRKGVCGSDAMNVNGRNMLACTTRLADLKQPIALRPLPGFPVIRDLVVDMKPFFDQYERIQPYLKNDTPPPGKEHLQLPSERAALDGLYECILCACCTSACPSFWWHPDKFVGPAGLMQAYRFVVDSRDDATDQRLKELSDPFSLFRCRTIMNCVAVCPKGLNPTKAISKLRANLLRQNT